MNRHPEFAIWRIEGSRCSLKKLSFYISALASRLLIHYRRKQSTCQILDILYTMPAGGEAMDCTLTILSAFMGGAIVLRQSNREGGKK